MKKGQAIVLESGENLIFFWDHVETFNPDTHTLRTASGAEYVLQKDSSGYLLGVLGIIRKEHV